MATKTKEDVFALEKSYWEAMKNRDAGTIGRLTDDTCIVVGQQGVEKMDRQAAVDMFKSMPMQITSYTLGEPQITHVGDDIALIAYRASMEFSDGGEKKQNEAYESSVWVRRNGSWVCPLHVETPVATVSQ
jgi:ketosteroid isomerase-like protein